MPNASNYTMLFTRGGYRVCQCRVSTFATARLEPEEWKKPVVSRIGRAVSLRPRALTFRLTARCTDVLVVSGIAVLSATKPATTA